MDSRRLPDKVAIVTGAGSGFGEGIARRFAAEGATVVVNDINLREGERVASEIRAAGGAAIFCAGDVSLDADVAALVHSALAGYGRVDVIVNNAGTTHRNQPLLDVAEAEFDRIYAVNVKSIYLTTLAAVPRMERRGAGIIINIASTAGEPRQVHRRHPARAYVAAARHRERRALPRRSRVIVHHRRRA